MFRKLKSGLAGKGAKAKFRLDVAVERVEGLPPAVGAARLQWARGAKVAVTKLVPASGGAVTWNEELSQIVTLLKAGPHGYEAKAYEFKLQAPDRPGSHKPPATIGKAVLDMAKFAAAPGRAQHVTLQIPVPGGGGAALHLVVGAAEVNSMALDDDSMSVMTGASGLSSNSPIAVEQDLSGFSARHLAVDAPHPDQPPTQPGSSAVSPRTSALPSAAPSATDVGRASATGLPEPAAAQQQPAAVQQPTVAEVEVLRREAEDRDARVAALQRELAAAHQQLASLQLGASGNAPGSNDGQLQELQQQNASLAQEAAQLRAELAAVTSAAAASAGAGAVQLQEELAATQARASELEERLAVAEARPRSASDDRALDAAAAARLAAADQKIEQLMALVQQQQRAYASGGDGPSTREAELEERLAAAEHDAEEAEAMVQEAMGMVEAAQAEIAGLQAAHEALEAEAEELRKAAQHSSRWKEEREAKKEADWDARLKEAYKRMEESVVLAERTQREKDELQERYAVLLSEKQAVEAKLDPDAVDQQVALEVEAARCAAEAQARIEVEALAARLRTMEEYVEEADAKRLAAASRVGDLEQQLAAVKRGEDDTYSLIKSAEERADGLSLELQYAQGEVARLAAELALVQETVERRASEHQREAAVASSRADALQQELDEARAQLRQEAAMAGQLHSRVLLLEEQLESSKLQVVSAQQIAMAAGAGVGAAAGADLAQRRRLESDLAERQAAAEARATQLDALSRELAGVRASLADVQAARDTAQGQLAEAQRALAAGAAATAELEAALSSREAQLAAIQEVQRASMAALSARGGRGSTAGEDSDAAMAELRGQLEAQRKAHADEIAELTTQLAEAQSLAGYSAGEMAELVQQLAEAQGERGEAAAKLAEARDEIGRLRSGPDGELRAAIERLEKDVTIQRNRADVNALFKEEHDRIAQELVETKLVWAEAQEQIVKLKRSLVKSQEKNVTFASKLTKMETRMYQSFNADSVQKGSKKLGQKLSLRRGSKDGRPASAGADSDSPLPSPADP